MHTPRTVTETLSVGKDQMDQMMIRGKKSRVIHVTKQIMKHYCGNHVYGSYL